VDALPRNTSNLGSRCWKVDPVSAKFTGTKGLNDGQNGETVVSAVSNDTLANNTAKEVLQICSVAAGKPLCATRKRGLRREVSVSQGKRRRTSQYRGVCYHKMAGRWVAQIQFGGSGEYLGCYDREIDAAYAYDARARQLGLVKKCNFAEPRAGPHTRLLQSLQQKRRKAECASEQANIPKLPAATELPLSSPRALSLSAPPAPMLPKTSGPGDYRDYLMLHRVTSELCLGLVWD